MLDKRTALLLLDDMAANAKLMKALRKDDDDAPRPQLAPSAPTSDMGTLKLKKSTLTGIASWDDLDGKLEHNGKHDFEVAAGEIASKKSAFSTAQQLICCGTLITSNK